MQKLLNTMKKLLSLTWSILMIGTLALTSCKDEVPPIEPPVTGETVIKAGVLSANETWTSDKIYLLVGRVVVPENITLTIEPGTIIKGKTGLGSLASALIVARGGKLMAVGTAANPIIFTSELDNIKVGEKAGTNLLRTDNEKWGGVALLGRAPVSTEFGDTEGNLEGIPVDDGYGLYGGTDPADNSGHLEYVSIRHCGITIGEGNELNALTTGGVGTGTIIRNIEIYATLDDGLEFFGGTHNASNCLVYFQGDDGIDLDQNYAGTIENFIVIHGDGIGTDEGLEIDGPEGSTYTDGKFTLRNGWVKNLGGDGSPSDFKSGAQGTIQNVKFEYGTKNHKVRASFTAECGTRTDALSNLLANPANLTFTNCEHAGVTVYTSSTSCATELAAAQTAAEGVMVSTTVNNPVDLADFAWTLTAIRGQLQ